MSVDLSKIKPGDEVLVRMVVTRERCNDFRGLYYVMCGSPYGHSSADGVPVLEDRIVSHTPAPEPLAVGDRVKFTPRAPDDPHRAPLGKIIHIHDGRAWVDWPTSMVAEVWPLPELELVP